MTKDLVRRDRCKAEKPTFITRGGTDDLPVTNLEAYGALPNRFELLDALARGRQDIEAGRSQPARAHVASLRQRCGPS